MELQEISDRIEITELLSRYCHALDRKDWQAFHACFCPDAELDFSAFGGPKGGVAELEAFLTPVLNSLANAQHMIASIMIDLNSDTARVRSAGLVPMITRAEDGSEQPTFNGLWYEDECVRTDSGWHFRSRVQIRAWVHTPLNSTTR